MLEYQSCYTSIDAYTTLKEFSRSTKGQGPVSWQTPGVTDYSSTKNSSTKTPRYDRRSNDKSRIRKVHDTKYPRRENSSLQQCTTWQIPDATYRRCVSFATRNVTDAKTPRKNFPRKVSYSWSFTSCWVVNRRLLLQRVSCLYELPWP